MDENRYLEIGEETVDLGAKGRPQLKRLVGVTKFLDTYGEETIREFDFTNLDEDASISFLPLLIKFVGSLDEEAFIQIGEVVSGKDREFVEENFDVEWVMEGLDWLIQHGPVRKVVERFFGNQG